jgi:glyoxylase-like metal-dependent hydrolase (beta-lactamase superfamily II)
MTSRKLGKFQLSLLSGGKFWLDGGAMFGVIPKVLWNKSNPSDDHNRIELGLNCLLIETGERNVLVDTGILPSSEEKFRKIYKVDHTDIRTALSVKGLTPTSIDIVINSHLHFDHCGGNTSVVDGTFLPSFPRARYVMQQLEWDDATHPSERTRASYIPETFEPVMNAGNVELADGNIEVLPGVQVWVTGGHTRGHQVVFLQSEGQKAIYLADIVPTASHIKTPYVMGYDLYPLDTMTEKERLLKMALEEHWLLIFEHDPKYGMGYLEKKDGKVVFVPDE